MTYFELRPAINDDKAVEIQVTEEFLDKYNVCTSEYMSGVKVDEYAAFADTIVFAAHSRAVNLLAAL